MHVKYKRHKMFIHWKSLLAFGLIFWLLLCATDLFGGHPRGYIYNVEDYDLLYEALYMEKLDRSENVILKLRDFGALLLLWNFATFVCSVIVCQFVKSCWWLIFNVKIKTILWKCLTLNFARTNSLSKINSTVSKIPIKIKPAPLTSLQVMDLKKRLALKSDVSCPNFLRERTCSNLSDSTTKSAPRCHMLFRNNKIFIPPKEERFMDTRQITKLRAEILRLQSKFQKEHSDLLKKVDIANKEKKDINKQLLAIQKDNKTARQQIEELIQEKGMLLKKLEIATKDIKSNTKSKKAVMTKLEELTISSETLKQELEQVSRDKNILENKLKVLQGEYEKLQERIILPSDVNFREDYHVNTPERDTNDRNINNTNTNKMEKTQSIGRFSEKTDIEQQSISQTELDMKNIQVKIKQLEKNLENFNAEKPEFNFKKSDPELNLNFGDNKNVYDEDTDNDYFFPNTSPRLRYWSGRAGDVIQSLASKVNDKVRCLNNIKEKCETEVDEYSSQESLEDLRTPRRIVSSSVAFQKFLKNLQPDSARLPYDSQSECCF
ncbi:uncharacterized protein LOC130894343 isoform X2 [Diorhabda carinulata]|uniref:uncharacterized protein LOC130894343 isoform X2 n=1 Tax=Diorhabda carinulata TaxID=1163345 RepID=UPI0025A2EF11|nr:uncharacterized protein LOC130894343 isoform X2 [Diorhabda carinulata]